MLTSTVMETPEHEFEDEDWEDDEEELDTEEELELDPEDLGES
jgi:hypothetical protein